MALWTPRRYRGSTPQGKSHDRRMFGEPYVGNEAIPPRGGQLKGGGTFLGLESDRLIEELLADRALYKKTDRPGYMSNNIPNVIETLAPQAYIIRENIANDTITDGHLAGSIGKGKIQNAGTWPESDIPQLAKGKIKADNRWQHNDQAQDTVYGDNQGVLSYKKLSERPTIPTKKQVKRWAEAAAKGGNKKKN